MFAPVIGLQEVRRSAILVEAGDPLFRQIVALDCH